MARPAELRNVSYLKISRPARMWLAYTCAVVLPAAVVPIRFDLGFSVEQGPAIVLFIIPIVLSAYFGGLGPGLLSTILSGGLAVYYVLPPLHDFHVVSGFNRLQLTSLLAVGTFVSVMAQKLHRSIAQLTFSAERLLESEERFSKAFRFNPVGIVIVRMSDNRYVEVNDAFAKMIGYTREELLGHSKVELGIMRPEQHDKYLAPLRAGGSTVNAECTMKTKEGVVRHLLTSVEVITLQGKPHRLGCIVDITDRDRMEAALSASEAEFRSMVDNAPYGIYRTVVEGGGNFVFVNPAMIKMLGYDSAEEVLALNLERQLYKTADDRAAVIALLRAQGGFTNLELHWRKKDGKELIVSASGRMVRTEDGRELIESIAEDISERRQLERQLVQSQKMEAVGRLAGGISHDFNNILNVITGYSEIAKGTLDAAHPVSGYLVQINAAAMRAANLTRQLLMFSRQQVVFPKIVDLSVVVDNMMKMLSRTIGEDIALSFRPEVPLGCVRADVGQIEQILMNLVVNARDAMPDGGQITIETRDAELDETYRSFHEPVIPGPYVMLSVNDTGCGMDETTRTHIFEPFFTTKEPGKGTGLGLSTVYGIVKQSGAYIWVYSEPGRGATIKIYFPRVQEKPDEARETCEPTILGGTETILLVEDDQLLRNVTFRLLSGVGYKVLEAETPNQAIQMAQDNAEPIDLVLTDVIMPVMGGFELSTRLKALRPELKVIFTSGYTGNALARQMPVAGPFVLIEKPYSRASLLTRVYEVLRGHADGHHVTPAPLD